MEALRCSFFICLTSILIILTDETDNITRQKTHDDDKINKIKRYLASLVKRSQWKDEDQISISGEVTPELDPDFHEESFEKIPGIESDGSDQFININASIVHSLSTYKNEVVKTNILKDYTLWLGAAVGSIFTLLSIVSAYLTWEVLRRRASRRRRLDFDDMSTSPFIRNYDRKKPVYVKLSHLHSPRRSSNSQYVVSVLDESNNFSIDSNSDTSSSSEEEIFNISGYASNDSSITSLRSPKVTMTSTPIKEGTSKVLSQSLQTTPTKHVRGHNRSLPISPLARRALHQMGSVSK